MKIALISQLLLATFAWSIEQHTELQHPPLTPHEADVTDAQLNALSSHYMDCINSTGDEERCFLQWLKECEMLYRGTCPLEDKWFATDGEEIC